MVGWSTFNYNLFYRTQNWLPNIINGQEFGFQISLNIVGGVNEVDELDEGNISAAPEK